MHISELDNNLKKVTDDFINDVKTNFPAGGDIDELSRFVYYALDEYRKQIVKYLNEK